MRQQPESGDRASARQRHGSGRAARGCVRPGRQDSPATTPIARWTRRQTRPPRIGGTPAREGDGRFAERRRNRGGEAIGQVAIEPGERGKFDRSGLQKIINTSIDSMNSTRQP
jgi:hypothetical protein